MLHEQIDLAIAEREAWVLRRQQGIPNNRRLWILTCMDERLPINQVLGIQLGDAHIFRNAGGLVTDDALRSAVLSTNFFGTKEIIVLNHTECGMMTASNEFVARALQAKYELDLPGLLLNEQSSSNLGHFHKNFAQWFKMFDNVDETCEDQVKLLCQHPLIPEDVTINGYIYEVESGRLRKPFEPIAQRVNTAEQMKRKNYVHHERVIYHDHSN